MTCCSGRSWARLFTYLTCQDTKPATSLSLCWWVLDRLLYLCPSSKNRLKQDSIAGESQVQANVKTAWCKHASCGKWLFAHSKALGTAHRCLHYAACHDWQAIVYQSMIPDYQMQKLLQARHTSCCLHLSGSVCRSIWSCWQCRSASIRAYAI